jgi:hypothetical protein
MQSPRIKPTLFKIKAT